MAKKQKAPAAPENKNAAAQVDENKDAAEAPAFDPKKRYKVTMKKTERGCDAGVIYPQEYKEGESYEIGASLYHSFKSTGAV